MTASSVERSKSIAPFTEFTRLGIRSWRRLSCTSICLKALMVWFFREISPLYAPTTQRTATATTTSRTHIIATPRFREVEPLRAVRQEFRDRLADRLCQRILIRAKPGERMIGIDVQLYASRDGDASPCRRHTSFLDGIPGEPCGQGPSGTAAWHAFGTLQGQPVRRWQRGTQHLSAATFQDVSGLILHVLGDRRESRAFHLPQFDGEQLEKMAIRIRRGGPSTFGRAHEAARHVEPNGALARRRTGGGVDRRHGGRVQHGADNDGEIAEIPGRKVAVFSEDVERIGVRHYRHASMAPLARSRCRTSDTQSATCCRLNGLRMTMQRWCSSQARTSSASASPVMMAMCPSSAGQRWMMARYSAKPDIVGK